MVDYHWGSRSSETVLIGAPASWMGGETLGYWHNGRQREPAAGAAVLVPC